ncbi:MAG: right-handed parallel beta-helix repeat-containing protein, partial [Thermoplasmata archaeon]|nr:right-handed parallel beta-helix repeat-containing protein [Thermoplasmata archaeon]
TTSYGTRLANNTIYSPTTGLDAGTGHNAIIRDNDVYADAYGIRVSGSDFQIIQNLVDGTTYTTTYGISVSGDGGIIENNDVLNVDSSGITMTTCTNFIVQGNNATGCAGPAYTGGIRVYKGENNRILNNNLSSSYNGIIILGQYTFSFYAINITVSGNVMYANPHIGIYLWDSALHCNITDNYVYSGTGINPLVGAIHIGTRSDHNHIIGNNISYNGNHGVIITTGINDVKDNWVLENDAPGIRINNTADAGNEIINNTITSGPNGGNCIQMNAEGSLIRLNQITQTHMNNFGIYISGTDSNTIEYNNITTTILNGLGISLGSGSCTNILRYNNITTHGDNAYGINLIDVGTPVDDNTLTGNNITTNGAGAYGINIQAATWTNLVDNLITTNGDNADGIYMIGAHNTWITGGTINVVFSSTPRGIDISGCTDVIIQNIDMVTSNALGIYLRDTSTNAEVRGSTINVAGNWGIYVLNSNSAEIQSNDIISTSVGIYASGSSGCRFESNTMTSGAGTGIEIVGGATTNNIIGNNTFEGKTRGISIDSGVGSGNVLYNNNFTDCTIYGLDVEEGADIVWYVDAICRIENNPCRLEGNITVQVGGDMRWDDSDLTFSPGANGWNYMDTEAGGILRITNTSAWDSENAFNYDFWVDGTIYAENSTIRQAGYIGGSFGIRVNSDNNLFYNVTIRESGYTGILLYGEHNLVQLCNISETPHTSIRLAGGNNTIRDSFLNATTYGIHGYLDNWGNIVHNNYLSGENQEAAFWGELETHDIRVTNNTFFDDGNGLSIMGLNLIIENNTFYTTIHGMVLVGSSLTITNNNGTGMSQEGIYISDGTGAVVSENNFSALTGYGIYIARY